MDLSTGNSGAKLIATIIKTGPECVQEGAFCKMLGEKVAPKVFAITSEGYVMSQLIKTPRTPDLLQRMEHLLETEVWNRPSQNYDVTGEMNYKEYHANLGLEIPDWAIPDKFCLTHGDPTVSNTMIREDGSLAFIDPRPPRGYVPSCRETDAARILQSFFHWEATVYDEVRIPYDLPKFWNDVNFRNRSLFWCAATTVRIKHLEESKSFLRSNVMTWCNDVKQLCLNLINGFSIVVFTDKNKIPFIIDAEDYLYVSKSKWHINNGYVANSKGKLHILLLGNAVNDWDHINQNKLDNRRSNLRDVICSINLLNRPGWSKGKIKGVAEYYDCNGNYRGWRSRIHVNGKEYFLGHFETKEEAIAARIEAEKKYYPELFNV